MDAQAAVTAILTALNIEPVTVNLNPVEGRLHLDLTVSEVDSGILIGFHGETIEAIQTLLSLMVNHGKTEYTPIMFDVNGYRQKRLTSLEALAQRAADQAVESGREIILPPLNAFERRHIHLKLESDARVSTYSEGEGDARRLIISPKAPLA